MGGTTAPIGFFINQTELTNAIRATYCGLESVLFHTLVKGVPCEDSTCSCCSNLFTSWWTDEAICQFGKLDRLHVPFYMSDDGAGFKSYVMEDHPMAHLLKYWQHVGSKYLIWLNCSFLSKFVIDILFGLWLQKLHFTNGLIGRFSSEFKRRLTLTVFMYIFNGHRALRSHIWHRFYGICWFSC